MTAFDAMSEKSNHIYFIENDTGTPVVRIVGRATCLNCEPFRAFIEPFTATPAATLIIDFERCLYMDSTFLGLFADAAMRLRKHKPPGKILARNLSARNYEQVKNLGLLHFLDIENPPCTTRREDPTAANSLGETAPVNRAAVIRAHEQLIAANPDNAEVFQEIVNGLCKSKTQR
ncbi:MAG: STAS domain-containing protein [Puniceicoccales bacterium]|jgi:anti-anti-sigma regulatory factor|nr:STAS domain-containing protein [Puniceicoccales bacterium]